MVLENSIFHSSISQLHIVKWKFSLIRPTLPCSGVAGAPHVLAWEAVGRNEGRRSRFRLALTHLLPALPERVTSGRLLLSPCFLISEGGRMVSTCQGCHMGSRKLTHTSHARPEHSAPSGDTSRCMGVGGRKCPAFQSGTLVSALPLIGRVAPGQPPLLLSLCSVTHILNPSRPMANSGSRRQTWPFPVPCSLLDPVPALFACWGAQHV